MSWKTIPGFEKYEVNTNGDIRNKKTGTVRKLDCNASGYYRLRVQTMNGYKRIMAHKAVALCFIPNPNNKTIIDHIDNNVKNNNINNLRWATVSENALNTKLRKNTKFKNVVRSGKNFYWRITVNFQTHRSEKTFKSPEEAFEDFKVNVRKFSEFASIQCATPVANPLPSGIIVSETLNN